MVDISHLETLSRQVRGKVVELSHNAKAPHLGSSLSCVDIIVALYSQILKVNSNMAADPDRDRFVLSKGHAAPALYTVLAMNNFFPFDLLDTFAKPESPLEEHPGPGCVPGVEAATGSLGHGLPIGVGMALSARITGRSFRTAVLLSDGECNEGTVWEAAMFAAARSLSNLLVIVDFNKWQATGRSREVMQLEPLKAKWEAFGWDAHEVDGHDMKAMLDVMYKFNENNSRPMAIIAHTIKGKGVSFMEDDNNWHYRIPTADEVLAAKRELGLL
ncbi:MAG: transketolase [Candidatus Riflebacteria bacterium]|nr:transketolase [Candidatus Riflebacteria bacterium]